MNVLIERAEDGSIRRVLGPFRNEQAARNFQSNYEEDTEIHPIEERSLHRYRFHFQSGDTAGGYSVPLPSDDMALKHVSAFNVRRGLESIIRVDDNTTIWSRDNDDTNRT